MQISVLPDSREKSLNWNRSICIKFGWKTQAVIMATVDNEKAIGRPVLINTNMLENINMLQRLCCLR